MHSSCVHTYPCYTRVFSSLNMLLFRCVSETDTRPPPLIQVGPQNQTLPISSLASLQCSAVGDPLPSVRWFKNDRLLTLNELRFALLDSGTLQIAGNNIK